MPEPSASKPAAVTRRQFLRTAAAVGLGGLAASRLPLAFGAETETATMPFANGQRALVKFPQKRPLILLTTRPPQLETPFSVFNDGLLTPNDAFFVRYHLSQVPTAIDPDKFTVAVKGKVASPLTLSIAELKGKFEPAEI